MYLYVHIAIKVACNFDKQWRPSEVANCSSYEYKNIQALTEKVQNVVFLYIIRMHSF